MRSNDLVVHRSIYRNDDWPLLVIDAAARAAEAELVQTKARIITTAERCSDPSPINNAVATRLIAADGAFTVTVSIEPSR